MLRTTVNAHLVLRVGRWEYLKAVWRCLESLEFNMISVDALVDYFAFRRRIKHPMIVWLPRDCAILALALSFIVVAEFCHAAMLPVSCGLLWYHYGPIVSQCVTDCMTMAGFHGSLKCLFHSVLQVGYSCPGTCLDWVFDKLKTPWSTRHDAAWLGMTNSRFGSV